MGKEAGKGFGSQKAYQCSWRIQSYLSQKPTSNFSLPSRVALNERREHAREKRTGATELKRAGGWTVRTIDDKVGWIYLFAPANELAVSKIAVGAFGVGLATGLVPILCPGRPILKALNRGGWFKCFVVPGCLVEKSKMAYQGPPRMEYRRGRRTGRMKYQTRRERASFQSKILDEKQEE